MPHQSSLGTPPLTYSTLQRGEDFVLPQPPTVMRLPLGGWSRSETPSIQNKGSALSMESPHDVAASALLLASSGRKADAGFEERKPFKKRKIVTDEDDLTESSNRLSPFSRRLSAASPFSSSISPSTLRSADTDDGEYLDEAMKKKISAFPDKLHSLLNGSEFAQKVVEWLPDGKAWRVKEWEALCHEILPKYFPELHDERSSKDAFVWQLKAWGFDEIQEKGTYGHKMFRKSLPKLCREMQFAPSACKGDYSSSGSITRARIIDRSILHVPSLTSTVATGSDMSDDSPAVIVRTPKGWPLLQCPSTIQYFSPQQQDDQWYYNPEAWVGHYRPRYSPVRCSGRGAARAIATQSNSASPSTLPSFPVSSRGMQQSGPRRISIPKADISSVSPGVVADTTGSEAAPTKPRSVLKRKLPLSSDHASSCTD